MDASHPATRRPSGRATAALVAALLCPSIFAQSSRPVSRSTTSPSAEDAVAELRSHVAAGRSAEAWRLRDAVRAAVSATKDARLAADAESLLLGAGLAAIGPAAGFRAKIESPRPGVVEATYEGGLAAWTDDFEVVPTLPTTQFAEIDRGVVRRTGALCHRALWAPDVRVTWEGFARAAKDFGPVFVDPDEQAAERFLVGFHNNAYFGTKYEEARAVSSGHVLLMAGRGAVSRARSRPTQLFGTGATPAVAVGDAVRATLALEGRRLAFETGLDPKRALKLGYELALGTQEFRRVQAGWLLRDSAFEPTRVVLRGRLDPDWEAAERARLEALLATPPRAR